MPLPQSHVQEKLSLAYVQTVVARAGAHYNSEDGPEYGIDCTIKPVKTMPDGSFTYSGYFLHCQVKATTDWEERKDYVIYDLKAEAYNKLAMFESKTAILIVMKLPKDEAEWIDCSEEQLALKHCCYWTIICDEPTTNTSSKRISLPRNQVFNPDAVRFLLGLLKQNKGSLV